MGMESFGKKAKDWLVYGTALAAGLVAANKMTKPSEEGPHKTSIKPPTEYLSHNFDTKGDRNILSIEETTTFSDTKGHTVNTAEQTKTEPQKQWILGVMNSKEYEERTAKEGLTKSDVRKRIKKVENTPIFRVETAKVNADGADGIEYGYNTSKGRQQVVVIGKGEAEVGQTFTVHELEHAATDAHSLMSQKAKDLYEVSYQPRPGDNEEYREYLKQATERDARKKQLEYELERMGFKKYGEVFTQEMYDQVMRFYDAGMFTYGARQFLETTKPEYFLQIMNEIAEEQAPENLPLENKA